MSFRGYWGWKRAAVLGRVNGGVWQPSNIVSKIQYEMGKPKKGGVKCVLICGGEEELQKVKCVM